jgi:hypothetical protein
VTGWSRAGAFDLDEEAVDRLSALLEFEEGRVLAACRRLQLSGPACALAFFYAQEHESPLAGWLALLTAEHRERLAERSEMASVMWQPAEWDHWDILDAVGVDDVGDRPERVAGDLIAAGCADPEGAFLTELAYRLSRGDWSAVMPVTTDFACFVVAHDLDWDNLETFRATVSPDIVRSWERGGWLASKTVSGLQATLRELGADSAQASRISRALLEVYDLDEATDWLDEPGIEGWLDDSEWEALARPQDWTPREAIRRGHTDLVIRAALGEAAV